ncbi:hypothetical protein AB0K51_11595 [Kitasatospora sp. NPDC049285]|uniref:hypothetical protein n=1 Tax=Kitasatospora sp. NPDC049285 TaxID=3157096 RepID=UPI003427D3E7
MAASGRDNHRSHERSSKQDRRARLAAERAAEARRERRRRIALRGGLGAAALALFGGVTAMAVTTTHSGSSPAAAAIPAQPRTTADGRTTAPPWDAPSGAAAAAAVRQAGLPMLTAEGTALHLHAHLDVYVNGQAVPVPADLGIDEQAGQVSPLHTHDGSGVIHVESPVQADFTLGQFLTEWQVSTSADHLGGLRTDADHTLTAYVNGQAVSGDPAAITLHAHDEIALVYGTAADNARVSVPGSYAFPSGM